MPCSFKRPFMLLQVLFLIFLFACSGSGTSTNSQNTSDLSDAGSDSGSDSSGGGSSSGGGGGSPTGGSTGASSGGTNFSSTSSWACNNAAPVAFPGAEGFGQCATGGRSSTATVCAVTSTAADPNGTTPGTFQYCLSQPDPGYIIFKTSGLINGMVTSVYANKTIAGHTSPGGIIVRGFQCDNGVWESSYRCNNMIVRHLRSRPLDGADFPDAFRFSGAKNVIVDHASLQNAGDENVEFSRSSYVTIQNSIIAEPVGGHYRFGGMLINYSKDLFPLGPLSLQHNFIGRSGGRYPEISCEENNDGPGTSNCNGRIFQFEMISNLIFDQEEEIVYGRCTRQSELNDCEASDPSFHVVMNWRNNRHMVRTSYAISGVIYNELFRFQNGVYASGNTWNLDPRQDLQLANAGGDTLNSQSAAYNYPAITSTASTAVPAYITANAGAFPRDTMDSRILGYISNINASPLARIGSGDTAIGIDVGDAHTVTGTSLTFPTDTDNDGMPDCWETAHGLNPSLQNHNGTELSSNSANGITGCSAGYSNLECFINQVAANRINRVYISECGM